MADDTLIRDTQFYIDSVKPIIGVELKDTGIDDVLKSILEITLPEAMILIQPLLPEIPRELDFIISSVMIVRYNRIGSEGKASSSQDGYSETWYDRSDFEPYKNIISGWQKINGIEGIGEPILTFV